MDWISAHDFEDLRYEKTKDGQIAKITINRPEVRNAFRPQTVREMLVAFDLAHEDPEVGVVILTGKVIWRFAPVVTRRCAAMPAMWVTMACLASISLMCRKRFVHFPSRSLLW